MNAETGMSDAVTHSASQTKIVNDKFTDRLTQESDTDAVVAFVPFGQMERETARKFFLSVRNVERGGLGGRKNLSSPFAVELLSWRDDRQIGIRYTAPDAPTRKRFARYLRRFSTDASAVEVESESFMDVSPGDYLSMATVTQRDRDYRKPIDDHPFVRNRPKTLFETITSAMRGDPESATNATVLVQFVCKPAISYAHKEWLNWHSGVNTRIGSMLKTYRAIFGGSVTEYLQSGIGPQPGYHATARIIAVSSDSEMATERVAQTAQCYQSASTPYRHGSRPVFAETRRVETLAMQAANREWTNDGITLSVDTLAAVTHPPAATEPLVDTERSAEREKRDR